MKQQHQGVSLSKNMLLSTLFPRSTVIAYKTCRWLGRWFFIFGGISYGLSWFRFRSRGLFLWGGVSPIEKDGWLEYGLLVVLVLSQQHAEEVQQVQLYI